ncbi:hypothetical protein G9464_16690 [Halostella sp. JP-L12]|nr:MULTISPECIES: hypothetical protein [Halostella]NHN49218.1 hypothetical protein [Halostella sp. JP-L12]
MIGVESLGGWSQAAAVIGAVLLEAIVLYVGYGALERFLGPSITDAIRGD